MQFSKKVTALARLHNIEPKDVLFAMLSTAGATVAESFATIYRPTTATNNALSTKASLYISQRPGLAKLIKSLQEEHTNNTETGPAAKRGRPRKNNPEEPQEDRPMIDYTNKDAVLQELARIAERSQKESDKLAAIREISALQRMKQEAAVEDEKRVQFYIPLGYDKCEELRQYLARYYDGKDGNTVDNIGMD